MAAQGMQNGMYGGYSGAMDPADDLDLIVDSGAAYASTFVAGAGAQGQGSVADDVRCYLCCWLCCCRLLRKAAAMWCTLVACCVIFFSKPSSELSSRFLPHCAYSTRHLVASTD